MQEYLIKQGSEPAFEAILWSRPENRTLAGKLLVVGGNDHLFAAPARAYGLALEAGAGECKVVMPSAVKKLVGKALPDCEFTPAAPSGSFGIKSLEPWQAFASWSNLTLFCGDMGRNSETAILLETFIGRVPTPLVLTRDTVDYFLKNPAPLTGRPQTTLVLSIAQLQKIAMHTPTLQAITFDMDFLKLAAWLRDFTLAHPVRIMLKHLANLYVAVEGQVSTTKLPQDIEVWRLQAAVLAGVLEMQNPAKPFEALTTAAYLVAYPHHAADSLTRMPSIKPA